MGNGDPHTIRRYIHENTLSVVRYFEIYGCVKIEAEAWSTYQMNNDWDLAKGKK